MDEPNPLAVATVVITVLVDEMPDRRLYNAIAHLQKMPLANTIIGKEVINILIDHLSKRGE